MIKIFRNYLHYDFQTKSKLIQEKNVNIAKKINSGIYRIHNINPK
jgi:hypothetical protein